jgi:hypothetical protein
MIMISSSRLLTFPLSISRHFLAAAPSPNVTWTLCELMPPIPIERRLRERSRRLQFVLYLIELKVRLLLSRSLSDAVSSSHQLCVDLFGIRRVASPLRAL